MTFLIRHSEFSSASSFSLLIYSYSTFAAVRDVPVMSVPIANIKLEEMELKTNGHISGFNNPSN
jgi:hypothetical protein